MTKATGSVAPQSENAQQALYQDGQAGDSSVQTYYPLVLILLYLVVTVAIAAWNSGSFSLQQAMNIFMGSFFMAFSFFKLLDLEGFAKAYSKYDLLASRWVEYGYIYPFIELSLGVLYLTGYYPLCTNALTLAVMGAGSIGVVRKILHKNPIQCACLGTIFNLPMSKITLVEDLSMAAMAGMNLLIAVR